MSLPSRERGLKCNGEKTIYIGVSVAPFAGAWIEIQRLLPKDRSRKVAPFAGAWIEIRIVEALQPLVLRRSLRGSVD